MIYLYVLLYLLSRLIELSKYAQPHLSPRPFEIPRSLRGMRGVVKIIPNDVRWALH